jgi:hypothetical protein
MNALAIHINLNPSQPKAYIHKLENIRGEQEIFIGFVDFRSFSDIGLDTRNIVIDTASYFVYLTKSPVGAIKNNVIYDRVYLNMIIFDPYGVDVHIAHFQTSKIFLFRKEDQFMDIALHSILYRQGLEL